MHTSYLSFFSTGKIWGWIFLHTKVSLISTKLFCNRIAKIAPIYSLLRKEQKCFNNAELTAQHQEGWTALPKLHRRDFLHITEFKCKMQNFSPSQNSSHNRIFLRLWQICSDDRAALWSGKVENSFRVSAATSGRASCTKLFFSPEYSSNTQSLSWDELEKRFQLLQQTHWLIWKPSWRRCRQWRWRRTLPWTTLTPGR